MYELLVRNCTVISFVLFQLPMNNKAVSVACLNLHYFVYVSKAVLKQAESCRTSARNRLMSIAVMADDIPEFTSTPATRRTSVTRRRKSAITHADNSSIDDVDNEQSMLSKQTASYMGSKLFPVHPHRCLSNCCYYQRF